MLSITIRAGGLWMLPGNKEIPPTSIWLPYQAIYGDGCFLPVIKATTGNLISCTNPRQQFFLKAEFTPIPAWLLLIVLIL
jgi:hypothetical protein